MASRHRFGFLFPILAMLAGCTAPPKGVTPLGDFEVDRYLGRWYEIARLDHSFERGLRNVTATYALRDDGRLAVTNRGFNAEKCEWREARGTARFREDPATASLAVTFFWPFAGGYHVIALDRDDYRYAMVAGPSRDYLWILARAPQLDPTIRDALLEGAKALDFPIESLIWVDHDPPDC